MKNAVIYVHGKGGSSDEANHYKKLFNDHYEIIGFDYKAELPWQAKEEFQNYFDFIAPKYSEILLIANSIGAYFSLISLSEKPITKALFISPIVDMELNYDEKGKGIRRRTEGKKDNQYFFRRTLIVGISFFRQEQSYNKTIHVFQNVLIFYSLNFYF